MKEQNSIPIVVEFTNTTAAVWSETGIQPKIIDSRAFGFSKAFVFPSTPEVLSAIESYAQGTLRVDPKLLLARRAELLKLIKTGGGACGE